jgi:hypothetical protein
MVSWGWLLGCVDRDDDDDDEEEEEEEVVIQCSAGRMQASLHRMRKPHACSESIHDRAFGFQRTL